MPQILMRTLLALPFVRQDTDAGSSLYREPSLRKSPAGERRPRLPEAAGRDYNFTSS